MDLDYIVDHITAEDVVVLVDRLADEFPECSYLFRSKCDECNWVPTPEVPEIQYYITVHGNHEPDQRVRVLYTLKKVFKIGNHQEVMRIVFPYVHKYASFWPEEWVLKDVQSLRDAGIECDYESVVVE
jgi:hypothetical protein